MSLATISYERYPSEAEYPNILFLGKHGMHSTNAQK